MPAKSYARKILGVWREILGTVESTGTANAGDIPALDDSGHLAPSLMPVGYGADTKVVPASEALTGPLVNLYDNAGVLNARNADATAEGKECNGFVLGTVAVNAQATVYFSRKITGLSGIVDGARYFLSKTPGMPTTTPVTGAGAIDQYIGKGASATEIVFMPSDYLVKAA